MFFNSITKSLRSLGIFLITFITISLMLGSFLVRDIEETSAVNEFIKNTINFTVSFEERFYDFRMRSQLNSEYQSKDIVLLEIDDYSLQKLGVWPIPRTYHAKMIDKLNAFGAKVVALDIMYPEKSPQAVGDSPDTIFANSIKNFQQDGRRIFIAYTIAEEGDETLVEAPVEMLNDAVMTQTKVGGDLIPKKINKYTFPIEELVLSEAGVGYIDNAADPDGIFRHYRLIVNVDTIYYGSLGYNAFKAFSGHSEPIKISYPGTGELEVKGKKMEISSNAEIRIRYIGAENTFPSVSLYNLIQAEDNDEKMKKIFDGKMVFVGSTATGAHDLRPSPLSSRMPGVYSHINVAHMLLHQYFYKLPDQSLYISLVFLTVGMAFFLFFQRYGNPSLDAAIMILILGGSYLADLKYFLPEGYELKLFYCYNCFIFSYTWNTFLKFYESNKEKKQIRGTFARYVAPTVVDEMLKDPEKLQVGGTKKDITCLFSDVRDFTNISESLSANELAHSLNLYMGAMTDIVFDTKGTLDKYIGDAIVALWGAPLEIGNHAQHAVEAAIKMMETLPSINEQFQKLGRPIFKVGIGLNSGECSVGNMGSSRIFSYTALGDNMNLGARLESLCKHYGAQILISDMTLERLDLTNIKTRPIDKVVVKGKTTAVGVHEVLHGNHWMYHDKEALEFYLTACKWFQMKDFVTAVDIFNQVLMVNPEDKPTKRYRDLCQKYLNHPELVTENFEVTVMTEK